MCINSLLQKFNINTRNHSVYLGLFLGMALGFSIYGYWLVDIFSATSNRVLFLTALVCLSAITGYFLIFELWIRPRFSRMSGWEKWLILTGSLVIGAFLMFTGTTTWISTSRYLVFLLPHEKLEISVANVPSLDDPEIVIQWFTTSVGDVSYDAIEYQGWTRRGNLLVMTNREKNSLEWVGKTGEYATLVLPTSRQGGTVNISWNGESRVVDLYSDKNEKRSLTHQFDVPFYSSRTLVLLLGVTSFSSFCFMVCLFVWERRSVFYEYVSRAISISPSQTAQMVGEKSSGYGKQQRAFYTDWMFVTGAMILATILRSFNLEILPPYTDEYTHLLAAKEILGGSSLNEVYERSLLIVTLPVSLFFRLFGVELWVARLAGVVFNALALIPLYLFTKKINRQTAWLACMLYTTSPWIIAVARNTREYAYYPFYYYWVIYVMLIFIERFPDKFCISNWKRILMPDILVPGMIMVLPVVYGLFIDHFSTFKVIIIAYGVLGLFVLLKWDLQDPLNRRFLAGLGVFLGIGLYIFVAQGYHVSIHAFEGYMLRYFAPNPPQQWYFEKPHFIFSAAIVASGLLGLFFRRTNFIPAFLFVLYFASILLFVFLFDRYIRPRYYFNIQLWFVPLVAVGLHGIWVFMDVVFPRLKFSGLMFILLTVGLSFNARHILLPAGYSQYGYMPITDEYHDDVYAAQSFFSDKVVSDHVLISTIYGKFVHFQGTPVFRAVYEFDFQQAVPREQILSIVGQNDAGWVVLDDRRYVVSTPLPLADLSVGDKKIEYVGQVANQYIWQWSVDISRP